MTARSPRDVDHAHCEPLQRSILRVEKPGAEIGSPAAVNDGSTHDVRPLVEREASGNAIVDDRLAIVVNAK